MLRLRPEDLGDPRELDKLARATGVSPEKFIETFGYLTEDEPAQTTPHGSRPPTS
jgi:hypothetical protein